MRWIVLIILALMATMPAMAQQQGREEAQKLEHERDEALAKAKAESRRAAKLQADIGKLQRQLIDVGQRISQQTWLQEEAEDRLDLMEQEANVKAAKIRKDHQDLKELLAALQRSEMSPPPPLAVTPDDTLAATRSAILLAATAPKLRDRANALKGELTELTELRNDVAQEREKYATEEKRLREQEDELQDLVAQRQKLEGQARSNAKTSHAHAEKLADRAASLRELIRQLEADAARLTPSIKPERPSRSDQFVLAPSLKPSRNTVASLPPVFHSPTARFADHRGQLQPPVVGQLEYGFGKSPDPDRDTGMIYATARRSQVLAPADGRIAYAGNFRDYGKLLILDVGEGYHIVLVGLGTSYVVQDQTVLAGEPVGKMPDRRKPAPKFYLEFRKHGQPFNPAPWLKKLEKTG